MTDPRLLLDEIQASITRYKLRAALDGDEQLTVVTLTQPCGCPVGEGHRCNPPF